MQRPAPLAAQNLRFGFAGLRESEIGRHGDECIQCGVQFFDSRQTVACQFNWRKSFGAKQPSELENGSGKRGHERLFAKNHYHCRTCDSTSEQNKSRIGLGLQPRSSTSLIIIKSTFPGRSEDTAMAQMTVTPVTAQDFLVDGKWISEGDTVEIRSPYDGAVVGRVFQGKREHAEAAIVAAVKAFGTTRRLPAFERQRVLRQVAQTVAERKEQFARVMAQEAGKPLKTARTEVERAIFTFTVAAEESTRIHGEYLALDWQEYTAGRWGIVRRFPLGPVAGITPFNFPLNLVAHKVAPAIAAGCPLVLKPAPQTPLTALMLAEAVQQAGWPDGALNVLPLSNEDAGLLVSDERIKLISFTGSAAVGWDIKRRAGKKKVLLELGGNAGVIVHSDADLDYAAGRCVTGGFSYAGQSCISVQRILVERSVLGKFTELLLAGVAKLKTGDPLDESADLGPMIRESDAIRATQWVEEAVRRRGAPVMRGASKRFTDGAHGADRHAARHEGELPGNLCSGGDGRRLRPF